MTTIERRTTGQPHFGLTEVQFRFFLSGYLLILAATAFALFIFAPVGLAVIAVASFALGYLCRSANRLEYVCSRMEQFELDILINGIMLVLAVASLAVAYKSNVPPDLSYRFLILCACWFGHMSAIRIGEFTRACWNGFRI